MLDRFASVGHDDEGALAREVIDQELEEGIYSKGFVYVSHGIEEDSCALGHHARPGRYRVDRNPAIIVSIYTGRARGRWFHT